jgi:hypothetical protein
VAAPLAGAAARVGAARARRVAPKLVGVAAAAALAGIGGMASVVVARPPAQAGADGPPSCPSPPGLLPLASAAAEKTSVPAAVLLAIACIETGYGRADNAASLAALVPPDIVATVEQSRLAPGGLTMVVLGLERRGLGSWVDPVPVITAHGVEHAMGFMQFIPSTWRSEAGAARPLLGHPADPYEPGDAMTVAGTYLASMAGPTHDLHAALRQYGGSDAYASRVMNMSILSRAARGRVLDCEWPVVTQPFGRVPGVFLGGIQVEPLVGGVPFHQGVDLVCPVGTAVRAVTAGVAHVEVRAWGYGTSVVVDTGGPGGEARVRYAHLASVAVVEGQRVVPGMTLGTEGSTGASTGPHLHFELDRRSPGGAYAPIAPCSLLDREWVAPGACARG